MQMLYPKSLLLKLSCTFEPPGWFDKTICGAAPPEVWEWGLQFAFRIESWEVLLTGLGTLLESSFLD